VIISSACATKSCSFSKEDKRCHNSTSAIAADFTISAIPSRTRLGSNVLSVLGSIKTPSGWAKVPTRFLAFLVLTAVLPPMLLSTCASKVVGTCKK